MPLVSIEEIFVPNTTTEVFVNSAGNRTQYLIKVNDGFVLHVKSSDDVVYDDATHEIEISRTERYCGGSTSVSINYDFSVVVPDTYTYTDENGMTVSIPIERIGAEELYTLPESIVPQNQIYGGGNGDAEVMSTEEPEQAEEL